MRFHPRVSLPARAIAALAEWQRELDAAISAEHARPMAERQTDASLAEERWRSHRGTRAIEAVVLALEAMASPDLARCMYCEHDRGAEIDHAAPKGLHPSRTFDWDNLVWACGTCNRQKLERYHPAMVIPTVDDPLRHLDLTTTGRWVPRDDDSRGRATLDTLPLLNNEALIRARQRWRRTLLRDLEALATSGAPSEVAMDRFREKATQDPFSDVFAALLAFLSLPGAAAFVPESVVSFVTAHGEMRLWLAEADAERALAATPSITTAAEGIRLRTSPAAPQ